MIQSKEACVKALEYWENFRSLTLKEKETVLLDSHTVEFPGEKDKYKEKEKKSKALKTHKEIVRKK